MSKVIITGSNGFIGKHLSKKLKSDGHDVFEISHKQGDITDPNLFNKINGATHVFHLAGRHFVPDSWVEPDDFMRVNLLGIQNVINYCLNNNSKLISASAYLYGIPSLNPISEKHTISPNNPYALSKHFGEQLIKFYSNFKNLNFVSMRLFNVYGAGQKDEYLIPSIYKQVIEKQNIEVNNFLPKRDYVYIKDVVRAFLLAMNVQEEGFFNIGSGVSHSVSELIETIKKITRSESKVISREIYRENEVMDVVADYSYAKKILGWEPEFTLEQGLTDMHKNNN